jgi:hypothetical protein
VKFMDLDAALVSVDPKPSDTSASRKVMKEIRDDMEDKMQLLMGRIVIMQNWLWCFDSFEMEREEVAQAHTRSEGEEQNKKKRAKIGK